MNYSTGVILVLAAGVFWSFIPIGVRSFEHADIWQILLYRSLGVLPFTLLLIHLLSERNAVHALRSAGISGFTGALGLVVASTPGVAHEAHHMLGLTRAVRLQPLDKQITHFEWQTQ